MEFTGERFVPHIEGDIRLEHLHRYLAARRLVQGKRVLDIACGEGYGSDLLTGAAAKVIGVDLDEASIAHARRTYARSNIEFLLGDATAIPVADSSVDVVVSFETIEHLTDHRTLMLEIKRVLAPGGVLVLSSPDRHEYSDVPRYKNPYHLRELYLSELQALLGEHFRKHAIYGQRVHYASVLAPVEDQAESFVGYRDSEGGIVEGVGLPNPVYFIAVASDEALPEFSAGVFIPREPPYMREIAALTEARQQLTAEFDQRGHRVEELAVGLNQATQREAALAAQLGQVATHAEELSTKLAAEENRHSQIQGEMDQRGQRVDELAVLLHRSTTELENLRGQYAEKERLYAEAVGLSQLVLGSRSWRITAPLRHVRLGLRKIKLALYRGAAATVRVVYRSLPIPFGIKMRLKGYLFNRISPVFAKTGAYARWQSKLATQHAAAPAASVDPALSSGEAQPLPLPLITEPLPVADGKWEWRSYAETRSRILQTLNARGAEIQFQPRSIIDIGNEDLAKAAARINLPSPGEAPSITVIVPVFNELATTIECLLSLSQTSGGLTFEVIVANDASTDRTQEVLSQVPNLRLVNQPKNLGFLRNCNVAAKQAQGTRLVLLNNDAQVSPDWLIGLMRALDEPGVGAVGPRFVYPNGVLQEAGVRIRRECEVEMIGLGDLPERPRWSYSRDVDYVSGACLMMETALYHALGGFNEELAPAYCEDIDLCLRVRERGLRIVFTPESEVVHHLSKSSSSLGATKHQLITKNMQRLSERYQATFDTMDDLRVIAMYLPQFHPVRENDLWWGPGFTEWSNVTKARPNFVGHDQPRLPADLGYYDLRLPEVMDAQWGLADRYGIDGFCYYYYWFNGERLLHRPLERLLDQASPASPFCLCWANENWTRRWDGQDQEVLMAQAHSEEDDLGVIRDLARYMSHPAYIRIRGRPLLLIYRTDLFPAFAETAERWRNECRRLGLGEIYLAMVESFRFAGASALPSLYGCDASVEFPAHYVPQIRPPKSDLLNPDFHGYIGDYDDLVVQYATREHPGFKRFRTVMPGWDNTARRQNQPFILDNPTPGAFQAWMETAIKETKRDLQGEERLLFVNAWNEWAEGAYLEPDRRFGHAYLQAVRNARDSAHILNGGES